MFKTDNPFARGYQDPHVVRILLITREDDCPPVWRPLHASQAHLSDSEVALFPCLIAKDFALITEGQEIHEALEAQCQTEGIVRTVAYAIEADDLDGRSLHVGDTYSEEAAREVARRLKFDTGFYSRCWEISSAHLTDEALCYLEALAISGTPGDLLFEVFRFPDSVGVGVKLIATPWTPAHLRLIDCGDVALLRRQQHDAGVPESLLTVLHLAAAADTRILIFDPDARALDDLPLYNH